MTDFKNNPEIKKNFDNYVTAREGIRMSLVICVWNTSHLLDRSLEMYCKQDLPKELWELIIIDDNSEDDCFEVIKQHAWGKINLRYIRLEHSYGMRGNTCAFNTGFAWGYGDIIAESTPETMFPENMLRKMYEPHLKHDGIFVSCKTFNLTPEIQMAIDKVDWREDIGNIMLIPGFFNPRTLNNFQTTYFGTHQTCSLKKTTFYKLFKNGYPLYCDYGSEDPRFSGLRERHGVRTITIMQPMAIHQWHPQWAFWATMGKAHNCNKNGHTIRNVMNDMSIDENGNRTVPDGGTCCIWDGGSTEGYSPEQIADQRTWDERVKATGCKLIP